jgi:hypothetical protein
MQKWLVRILIGFGVVVLAGVVLIGVAVFDLWYENDYKSEIQTIGIPNQNIRFVLLTDIAGFEDRAWYVYQVPVGADLTKRMQTGHNTEGALFWNYSEAGDHYDNPKIEIFKDRYLVFSRGGLFHSLYDLRQKTVLVNDESPWNSFLESEQFKKYGEKPPPGTAGTAMDVWVRENLHGKIERLINDAT